MCFVLSYIKGMQLEFVRTGVTEKEAENCDQSPPNGFGFRRYRRHRRHSIQTRERVEGRTDGGRIDGDQERGKERERTREREERERKRKNASILPLRTSLSRTALEDALLRHLKQQAAPEKALAPPVHPISAQQEGGPGVEQEMRMLESRDGGQVRRGGLRDEG